MGARPFRTEAEPRRVAAHRALGAAKLRGELVKPAAVAVLAEANRRQSQTPVLDDGKALVVDETAVSGTLLDSRLTGPSDESSSSRHAARCPLTPLRLALDAAVAAGLLDANPAGQVVLPRRRAGRAWSTRERRFLTRAELVRLLDEIPTKWRPLFELLAATGLRISEATGLRWSDLVLDEPAPHLQVRRAIVKGAIVAPKSRHGARLIPLTPELAATLRAHRPRNGVDDAFVFPGRDGGASDQGSLRRRVLIPAAERAGLTGVGFHTLRHTCASMLIESGLSPLRLQRWMGHHSPAFTLETYGHLIDGDLGPGLDLRKELPRLRP